ncbi:hypothetical protein WA026_009525 [Henosepilachna vigintioctopunctata]|uniref:Uncharacterized protein n=1 Tax=Henosepilachna vigintioctopunctata TaxID=420089 RepID=A0AAW1TVX4_9CUCU
MFSEFANWQRRRQDITASIDPGSSQAPRRRAKVSGVRCKTTTLDVPPPSEKSQFHVKYDLETEEIWPVVIILWPDCISYFVSSTIGNPGPRRVWRCLSKGSCTPPEKRRQSTAAQKGSRESVLFPPRIRRHDDGALHHHHPITQPTDGRDESGGPRTQIELGKDGEGGEEEKYTFLCYATATFYVLLS